MNGIYDLYQQYLAEAYAPKVSTTPAYDPFWFLKQQTQGEGGDNTGGITTLSPQQTRDRAMQMEFDAAALRDKDGKVVGGLTEEEQLLMDRMTGKAPLTNMQKATLGYGFAMPGTGIISMANLYAQRAMDARRAAQEMTALQNRANAEGIGYSAVTRPGTYSYDDSVVGGSGTGGGSGGETYGSVGSYEDFGTTY